MRETLHKHIASVAEVCYPHSQSRSLERNSTALQAFAGPFFGSGGDCFACRPPCFIGCTANAAISPNGIGFGRSTSAVQLVEKTPRDFFGGAKFIDSERLVHSGLHCGASRAKALANSVSVWDCCWSEQLCCQAKDGGAERITGRQFECAPPDTLRNTRVHVTIRQRPWLQYFAHSFIRARRLANASPRRYARSTSPST